MRKFAVVTVWGGGEVKLEIVEAETSSEVHENHQGDPDDGVYVSVFDITDGAPGVKLLA